MPAERVNTFQNGNSASSLESPHRARHGRCEAVRPTLLLHGFRHLQGSAQGTVLGAGHRTAFDPQHHPQSINQHDPQVTGGEIEDREENDLSKATQLFRTEQPSPQRLIHVDVGL